MYTNPNKKTKTSNTKKMTSDHFFANKNRVQLVVSNVGESSALPICLYQEYLVLCDDPVKRTITVKKSSDYHIPLKQAGIYLIITDGLVIMGFIKLLEYLCTEKSTIDKRKTELSDVICELYKITETEIGFISFRALLKIALEDLTLWNSTEWENFEDMETDFEKIKTTILMITKPYMMALENPENRKWVTFVPAFGSFLRA